MYYRLVKAKECNDDVHRYEGRARVGIGVAYNYPTLNSVFGAAEGYHNKTVCGCQVEVREQE